VDEVARVAVREPRRDLPQDLEEPRGRGLDGLRGGLVDVAVRVAAQVERAAAPAREVGQRLALRRREEEEGRARACGARR